MCLRAAKQPGSDVISLWVDHYYLEKRWRTLIKLIRSTPSVRFWTAAPGSPTVGAFANDSGYHGNGTLSLNFLGGTVKMPP